MRADVADPAAVVVELAVALGRERLAQLGAQPRSATSSRAGLRMVSSSSVRWWLTDLGQLLDGVVEGLGVGALELQHGEQRLVPLGVLLLAVLRLVLGDRVPAAQHRVDVLLLGQGVRDVQRRERLAYGVAVGCCCRAAARSSVSKRRWSSRISSMTSPETGRPRSMEVLMPPACQSGRDRRRRVRAAAAP